MKFFIENKCKCGVCGNGYDHTPLISNRWNERIECCSYNCYLNAIGLYSPSSEYNLTFRQRSRLLKNLLRKAFDLFRRISNIKIKYSSNQQIEPQQAFFHRHV
jgi:hypothetical protein